MWLKNVLGYINTPKITDKKQARPEVQRFQSLKNDTFEPTPLFANSDGYKIKCVPVKTVSIKDSKGNDTNALLVRSTTTKNQYFILKDDETLCRIFFGKDKDSVFIYDLKGKNNDGKFKGAGCELIKVAVEESVKLGHKGKISLSMADSLPFYFKCNFRIPSTEPAALRKNAFMDYMTRHPETAMADFMQNGWKAPECTALDEKGARAFLSGERFMDNSASKTLYDTILTDSKDGAVCIDVDFCDFSNDKSVNGKYVIQLVKKDGKAAEDGLPPQLACLEFEIETDDDGCKKPVIKSKDIIPKDPKLMDEIEKELHFALEKIILQSLLSR